MLKSPSSWLNGVSSVMLTSCCTNTKSYFPAEGELFLSGGLAWAVMGSRTKSTSCGSLSCIFTCDHEHIETKGWREESACVLISPKKYRLKSLMKFGSSYSDCMSWSVSCSLLGIWFNRKVVVSVRRVFTFALKASCTDDRKSRFNSHWTAIFSATCRLMGPCSATSSITDCQVINAEYKRSLSRRFK